MVIFLAAIMIACFQGVLFSWGDILMVFICGVTWCRGLGMGAGSGLVGGLILGAAQGNLACLRAVHYVSIAFLANRFDAAHRKGRVYAVGWLTCVSILALWGMAWWLEDSYAVGPVGVAATVAANCLLAVFLPRPSRS